MFPEERSQKSPCLSLAPWKKQEHFLDMLHFHWLCFSTVSILFIRYFDVGLLWYHLVCMDKERLLTIFHFLVRSIKTL